MTTSRREFFKTAAMGAVGAGAAFGTVAAEAKAAAPSKYDIIILGAGCGGLTCAVRAAENGLKPLLLEKMAMPAGNTIYAAGFLLGVNTSFQKAKNVQGDSAEQFLKDWMKVSQGQGDEKLARVVCENADGMLEWMHEFCAVNFAAGSKLVWPMLSRAHHVNGETKPGGGHLAKTLRVKAKALGVEVRMNTKAVVLLSDEQTGVVNGVRIKTKEGLSDVHSNFGVVVATGGFSALRPRRF